MRLYDSLVRRLYQINLFHPAKMGLTNTLRLYEGLGSPIDKLPAVHIAGTNGKGSVALKMARSLQMGGVRIGLFVSPHVSCFRERMQVDGVLISEQEVVDILPKIFHLCESQDIPATFFEITTALAFQHFETSKVDAIVIETGLGGRLDATNIVTPSLSIITSIGLEHTKILGNTLEEIAVEKAGIIKPGVPVLVGDNCPVDLLKDIADRRKSPFFRVKNVFTDGPLPPPVDYDEENTRLAEAGLRLLSRTNPDLTVDEDTLRKGVSQRPPCRFEVLQVDVGSRGATQTSSSSSIGSSVSPLERQQEEDDGGEEKKREEVSSTPTVVTVVLDAAHNPPAIVRFFDKLRRDFPGRRYRVVAAFSGDKDSADCLSTILANAGRDRIHIAEASTPRATPSAVLGSNLKEISGGRFDGSSRVRAGNGSVRQAVRDALSEAAVSGGSGGSSENDLVVVCGTVFMMVDAREELGFDEPQDAACVAEVAGSHFRAAQDNLECSGTDG